MTKETLIGDYFENAQEAFEYLYDVIMMGGNTKEGTLYTRNVSFTIANPKENEIETPWRKWKKDYAELEYNWYMTGDRNPEMVEKQAKIWSQIKDDSGYVNSNYGAWWKRNMQLERMLILLDKEPLTRRAVLVHYDVDEVQDYTKDTPCNIVLNFYIRPDERLCLTVFARSIDLVYGFCNDQYCFSKLQQHVAKLLKRKVGCVHYFITDLHIYEKHWEMKQPNYNSI